MISVVQEYGGGNHGRVRPYHLVSWHQQVGAARKVDHADGQSFYTVWSPELMSEASVPSLLSPHKQKSHPPARAHDPCRPLTEALEAHLQKHLCFTFTSRRRGLPNQHNVSHVVQAPVSGSASLDQVHHLCALSSPLGNRTCSQGCCHDARA